MTAVPSLNDQLIIMTADRDLHKRISEEQADRIQSLESQLEDANERVDRYDYDRRELKRVFKDAREKSRELEQQLSESQEAVATAETQRDDVLEDLLDAFKVLNDIINMDNFTELLTESQLDLLSDIEQKYGEAMVAKHSKEG